MVLRFLLIAVLLLWLFGCQTRVPMWRPEAGVALDKIRGSGAQVLLPIEYMSLEESYALGNSYLEAGDCENAERQYFLTLRNAEALEKRISEEKTRLEEIRNLEENTGKKDNEQQKEAEEIVNEQGEKKGESFEKPKKNKERMLAASHTVMRGETLPYIAALPEVYNDSSLWPLLYRANRDQIRDPNYIWPGQVLRIPRNSNREDISDARRPTKD